MSSLPDPHEETVLRYLAHAAEGLSEEGLKKAVEAALPETGGGIMPTLAEKWIDQGILKGKREALEGILQARFGPLPTGIREEIQEISSVERLDELILKAATAGSLEEFSRQGCGVSPSP